MTHHPGANLARGIGSTVLELADARGWDVKQLADRAGIVPTQLRRMMNGDDAMNTDHMVRLSRALGVTVTDLLAGQSDDVESVAVSDADFEEVLTRARAEGWAMQGA